MNILFRTKHLELLHPQMPNSYFSLLQLYSNLNSYKICSCTCFVNSIFARLKYFKSISISGHIPPFAIPSFFNLSPILNYPVNYLWFILMIYNWNPSPIPAVFKILLDLKCHQFGKTFPNYEFIGLRTSNFFSPSESTMSSLEKIWSFICS